MLELSIAQRVLSESFSLSLREITWMTQGPVGPTATLVEGCRISVDTATRRSSDMSYPSVDPRWTSHPDRAAVAPALLP